MSASATAISIAPVQNAAAAQLSPLQAKAAIALANGATITAAADSLGIHRTTIYHWFKHDPLFQTAVTEIRRERYERTKDEMREIETLALTALRRLLSDADVPAGVCLKAALAVFNRPKDDSGLEIWEIPAMENVQQTLHRRPGLAEPFEFDANRPDPSASLPGSFDVIRHNSTHGLNFEAPVLLPEPEEEVEAEEDYEEEDLQEELTEDAPSFHTIRQISTEMLKSLTGHTAQQPSGLRPGVASLPSYLPALPGIPSPAHPRTAAG